MSKKINKLDLLDDDDWGDNDLDFGTFDNSLELDFEDLIDLLDNRELDRMNMDYDYLSKDLDKTFENESKINSSPKNQCSHEMERKYLIYSFYLKCKKCGHEED